MSYPSVSVSSFLKAILIGFWEVKAILALILVVLAADIVAMGELSPNWSSGVREAIGWFFGNGSGVQQLLWPQMVCCILAAIVGYLFLGVILAVVVEAFRLPIPD